jgi:hypothetical protein
MTSDKIRPHRLERVYRLLINQHGVDDAAHLDQLLPVPAVAGKARHLPRRHRTDLTEANLGDPSTVSICDQPSAARRSRMAFCSALLSRLCRTWWAEDCRT